MIGIQMLAQLRLEVIGLDIGPIRGRRDGKARRYANPGTRQCTSHLGQAGILAAYKANVAGFGLVEPEDGLSRCRGRGRVLTRRRFPFDLLLDVNRHLPLPRV